MTDSYTFKKFSKTDFLEEIPDNATLLIEDGGDIKRVPASQVGGTDGVKTVNGVEPDETGNVSIDFPECVVQTVNGVAPDEAGNVEITIDGDDVITQDKLDDALFNFKKYELPEPIGRKGSGINSVIFGDTYCEASDQGTFAQGSNAKATAVCAHAEGNGTRATGVYSHAEGLGTEASGSNSHAEGNKTKASQSYAHAEGDSTIADGNSAHTEGYHTVAKAWAAHAEGWYTTANGKAQHVQGAFNIVDESEVVGDLRLRKYAHIVGNGKSDTARSNAHTLDWEGNAWYQGTVEGTAMIVKSSTSGSTKRFKITVDDSGTISATEITE